MHNLWLTSSRRKPPRASLQTAHSWNQQRVKRGADDVILGFGLQVGEENSAWPRNNLRRAREGASPARRRTSRRIRHGSLPWRKRHTVASRNWRRWTFADRRATFESSAALARNGRHFH